MGIDLLFFQDANSVPEIFLKDLRDYTFTTLAHPEGETGGGYIQAGYYRVRKLADGNCWMTENLDHPQQTGHYYYNWDTDLNSKTKWAPTANFIDGTVEGIPADIRVYKDSNVRNDYTFMGNGCNNTWGTDGDGGSITPCSTRIVRSSDNEDQKNGTYYTFQAATSGSGAAIATNNANTPDTFCPLGWQLPYSGTGGDYYNKSRSWYFLFTSYGIAFNIGTAADATKAMSYPLSYIKAGIIRLDTGRLYFLAVEGIYWSITTANTENAYRMHLSDVDVQPQQSNYRPGGFPIRCTPGFSILTII